MNTPIVFTNLELATDWIQPGNVGNDGGGSTKPHGNFVMTPGGSIYVPAVFSAKGVVPYDNGYWYKQLSGVLNSMTYFRYKLNVMLPTSYDMASCQALEFELQQNVSGQIHNMAWQADLKNSKVWRTFDYNLSQWIPTGLPINLASGVWTTVDATFLCTASTTTHISLGINGIVTPINITRPATPKVESDYVNCAFQLDSNSLFAPYKCLVENMSVTMLATG